MKVFAAHGPMVEVKPDDQGSLYVRLSDHEAEVRALHTLIEELEERLRGPGERAQRWRPSG